MQIRTRLSLNFTIVSAVLLLILLAAVYLLFARHITDDFYKALKERAIVTAQVYLEADEISDSSLRHFKEEYLNTLPDEIIRMYDSTDAPAFIQDNDHHWKPATINNARSNKYVQYTDGKKQVVGIRYDDNQGIFVILVTAVDKTGTNLKKNLFRIILFLYLLQVIILFVTGRWFAQKVLQPIQKINQQVQRISATDLHLRLSEANGKDEISVLAINFNKLLDRLEAAFDMQKTFVANASHELRTPVTNIIGETEVAIGKVRTNDEYEQLITSVLKEAEKLDHTITALLSLANVESLSLQKAGPVRLDEVFWELEQEFKQNKSSDAVHFQILSLPQDEKELLIIANKHLLQLAFSNIIRNAVKFSNYQCVQCVLEDTPTAISISVRDKGIGITAEELQYIFQPFYRGRHAASFEGHGMGLFIAKKIVDRYHGHMIVNSKTGEGTTINILFAKNSGF